MAEILGQAKDSQEVTHELLDSIYNYSTNQKMDVQDDMQRLRWENANKGIEKVYNYMQDPNYSRNDIVHLFDNGSMSDLQSTYGGIDDIIRAAQNYGDYQKQAKIDKEASARAAIDEKNKAPLEYKRGELSVSVPRAFTDYIVEKERELGAAVTDEEKDAIYRDIMSELAKMEGTPVANDDASLIKDAKGLYSRYADPASRIIIDDILNMARNRKDEVYTPEEDNRSWEDRYYERMERQYQIDKEKEARRLERERLGHGIAGLAATIGDMVRASEGAPVSQRDWQRIYDNLTAQEKANVNNYQIRMAKLNEDIRADRARQQAVALSAAQRQQEREDKFSLEALKQKGALGKQAAADAAAMERTKQAGKDRIEAAKQRANKSGDQLKGTVPITFGGENFYMRNTETFKQACRKINGMLAKWNIPINLTAQIGLASSRTDEAVNGVTNALEQLEIVSSTSFAPDRARKQVTQKEYDEIKSYLNSIKVSAGGNDNNDDGWNGYDD